MNATNESPIFSKCFDLLLWITNHTEKFPKNERFRLAKRIEDSAFEFHNHIMHAAFEKRKSNPKIRVLQNLRNADLELSKLRFYIRLGHSKKLTTTNQYEYISMQLIELGKLLGGWIKAIQFP